ncbi:MAG: hypothetical protein J1E39_08865 [Eubacterium sp.]|nr:hypothetical protein [Eubacterium sp.]
MSIGFSFSGRIDNADELIQNARNMAGELGYGLGVGDNGMRCVLCPMGGDLYFRWQSDGQGLRVEGDCQSTPAGPGFHKAAIEFTEKLMIMANAADFSLQDETDYYSHRDFNRMKQEHFYSWLDNIIDLCRRQHGEVSSLRLCWDMDSYCPEDVPDTIVTPMGRFTILEIEDIVSRQGIEAFADMFFLWNSPNADAAFYRNRAVNALWELCWFAPSSRSEYDKHINSGIVDDVERAYMLEPTLPLPVEEYMEICVLDGRTPIIPTDTPSLKYSFPVGFRKSPVSYEYGRLQITLPGKYQYEREEYENGGGTDLWWDASTDSPIWRINGYTINNGTADFTPHINGLNDLEDIEFRNGKARFGWTQFEEDGDICYQMQCQAVTGQSLFLITVTYTAAEQRAEITELLKKLTAAPEVNER